MIFRISLILTALKSTRDMRLRIMKVIGAGFVFERQAIKIVSTYKNESKISILLGKAGSLIK